MTPCEARTLVHLKLDLEHVWFLGPNEKIEVSSKQGASVCQMQHMDAPQTKNLATSCREICTLKLENSVEGCAVLLM